MNLMEISLVFTFLFFLQLLSQVLLSTFDILMFVNVFQHLTRNITIYELLTLNLKKCVMFIEIKLELQAHRIEKPELIFKMFQLLSFDSRTTYCTVCIIAYITHKIALTLNIWVDIYEFSIRAKDRTTIIVDIIDMNLEAPLITSFWWILKPLIKELGQVHDTTFD